jgi:hypothetical protein
VVTITETVTGREIPMAPKQLTTYGYRPRVWGDNLVAASEDKIYVVDPHGTIAEFGPGFMPEPQRNGVGIAWQDRPVVEPDHWSGHDVRRGALLIRWKKGTTTTVPNAVEARWTPAGGVLATVLRADPVPGQPWWSGGTDLWYIANAKTAPVLVAPDARSGAPHPKDAICAAVGSTGSLILCAYDGSFRHQIAPLGEQPSWSHDGRRLMVEEPIEGKSEPFLRVYLFKSQEQQRKK